MKARFALGACATALSLGACATALSLGACATALSLGACATAPADEGVGVGQGASSAWKSDSIESPTDTRVTLEPGRWHDDTLSVAEGWHLYHLTPYAEERRAAFIAAEHVEDPRLHTPDTIDCASCHAAGPVIDMVAPRRFQLVRGRRPSRRTPASCPPPTPRARPGPSTRTT